MSNREHLRELKRLCQAHGATMETRIKGNVTLVTVAYFGRTLKLSVSRKPGPNDVKNYPSAVRRFLADAAPPPPHNCMKSGR